MALYYFKQAADNGSGAAILELAKYFGEGDEKSEYHFQGFNNYYKWLQKEQSEVEFLDEDNF